METYITPPHEVTDENKLESLIKALENGVNLPPVVVYAGQAYSGSHRLAAWEACGRDPAVIELSETEMLMAICKYNGYDYDPDFDDANEVLATEICDYSRFCEALLAVTERDEVREAIADQIY